MINRCFICGNWIRREVERKTYSIEHGDIYTHPQCNHLAGAFGVNHRDNPGHPFVATECFTSTNEHGECSLFDIFGLRQKLLREGVAPIVAEVPREVALEIGRKNEIDLEDANAISKARHLEGTLYDPLILVIRPDGKNFIIDGSHRLVSGSAHGVTKFLAWAVEWTYTDDHRIDNWDDSHDEAISVNSTTQIV